MDLREGVEIDVLPVALRVGLSAGFRSSAVQERWTVGGGTFFSLGYRLPFQVFASAIERPLGWRSERTMLLS